MTNNNMVISYPTLRIKIKHLNNSDDAQINN